MKLGENQLFRCLGELGDLRGYNLTGQDRSYASNLTA